MAESGSGSALGPGSGRDGCCSSSSSPSPAGKSQAAPGTAGAGEYCRKVQEWLWQYYSYVQWQSWMMMMAPLPPYCPFPGSGGARPGEGEEAAATTTTTLPGAYNPFPIYPPYFTLGVAAAVPPASGEHPQQQQQQEVATASGNRVGLPGTNAQQQPAAGNVHPRGREYTIPTLMHRFLAEMVDFLILFLLKAVVVLTVMHICGIKDLSKFALNYIIEEIDEDTSLEDLQKMMAVALMYRLLVCFYEIVCLWGVGGATPGKFLLGLRVVSCDSSVLVAPNRVLVIPAQNVSISSKQEPHCQEPSAGLNLSPNPKVLELSMEELFLPVVDGKDFTVAGELSKGLTAHCVDDDGKMNSWNRQKKNRRHRFK